MSGCNKLKNEDLNLCPVSRDKTCECKDKIERMYPVEGAILKNNDHFYLLTEYTKEDFFPT